MGISGLLPCFKSITKPVHVREYSGKRAAVDIYSWLHKGAFGCSKDLIDGTPTDSVVHLPIRFGMTSQQRGEVLRWRRYIDYCMHRVDLLRHHQITPVLVFDGGLLPMKASQESKRQRSRKDYLARAVEHERQGNQTAAYECYQKAVDITPAIALRLIQVLKEKGVEFIVAPYEADAQMAFLARNEYVSVVITEDSDMIAYRCPRVLYKMDKFGQGMEIEYKDIVKSKELNFSNFTDDMLLEMCVLSGCDYLSSLPGLGVKKAHNLVRRLKSYRKVIQSLTFNGVSVPKEYEDTFRKALLTFKHQRVYDPEKKQVVHLSDPEEGMDLSQDHDFVGPDVAPDLARAIAQGDVNPITLEPFQEDEQRGSQPVRTPQASPAVCFKTSFGPTKLKSRPMPSQKNKLSTYYTPVSDAARKDFKAPRKTEKRGTFEKPAEIFPFSQDTPDSQDATPSPVTPCGANSPTTPIASTFGGAQAGRDGGGKRKEREGSLGDLKWNPGSPEVTSLSPSLSRLESCNGGTSPCLPEWEIMKSDCCSSENSDGLLGNWSPDRDGEDPVSVSRYHAMSGGDSWTEESTEEENFWDGGPALSSRETSRNPPRYRKNRHQNAKALEIDFCEKMPKRSRSMNFDESLAELDVPKKKVSPLVDFDQFAFDVPHRSRDTHEGSRFTDSDSGSPFTDFEKLSAESLISTPPPSAFPARTSTDRHRRLTKPTEVDLQDPFSNSERRIPFFGAATPQGLQRKKSRFAAPLRQTGWSSDNPGIESSPDSPLPTPCWTPKGSEQGTASPVDDDTQADELPRSNVCLDEEEDASGGSPGSSPEMTAPEERRPYLDEISKQSFATNVAHLPHYKYTGHNVVHRVAASLHKSTKKKVWNSGF